LNKKKSIFFKLLKSFKDQKLVNKIGVSIYNFDDIKKLNEIFDIQLFQVPFNIFDQRLRNLEMLDFLKKNKIEIHVRSIFLQGALFMSCSKAKKKIKDKRFILKLNELNNLCKKEKIKKIDLLINYIQNHKFIKNKLIAPVSLNQMNEIISSKYIDISKFDLKFLNIREKKLINPSFWEK
jgi:aryl-alcohol dehydrogenase-like predicted oxidoreductase